MAAVFLPEVLLDSPINSLALLFGVEEEGSWPSENLVLDKLQLRELPFTQTA